jgi:hAT family C-terminal dimerisation region
MIQNVKKTWQTEYHTVSRQDRPPLQRQPTIVERHLRQAHTPVAYNDEFDSYINAPTTEFASPWDCIPWLRTELNQWPNITQQALDLLCIPAMSAELEQVFSQVKLTTTPQRNRLAAETIETLELMRFWYSNGIVKRPQGRR